GRLLQEVMDLRGPGTPPTESILETYTVQLFRQRGVEIVARQVKVYGGKTLLGRVDFILPNWVALEMDGADHEGRRTQDYRRDRTMERLGLTVHRGGWDDATHRARKFVLDMEELIERGRRDPCPIQNSVLRL